MGASLRFSHLAAELTTLTVQSRLHVLLWIVLLVVFSTSYGRAAQHPVPLDPKADPSTCLTCHEDKSKGPHVHTAVKTGCTSCHEIRVTKDITRVKLTTTTPTALCLSCHEDKKQVAGQTIHPPAVRDCIKCHDPHVSPNENQLLKPTTGATKDDNLCLACHTQGTNVPKGGSRHLALDMGCGTCHVTHKTGETEKQEFDYHLTKSAPALCIDCHDVKDANLIKAHQGQPFTTTNCVQCHDPHQSSQANLMQKFTHPPFATNACDTCHQPSRDGKVVLTQTDSKALCVTCHADKAEQIDKAKVQHPGAAGDCTDCHSAHASQTPGLPKTNGVEICLGCHSDIAEQGKKKVLHEPAFKEACGTCHDAHGNDNEKLLRVKSVNGLCLECHGPDAPEPQQVENQPAISIFNGKALLPEGYFKKVPILPLKYGAGHPTQFHPVTDVMDAKTKTMVKIDCLTCHQPHSSANAGLLVKDQRVNMAFCKTCHKEGTVQLQ
jgi:predicted CXXCH cytochrome family protein